MLADDTDSLTRALLERNNYFGAERAPSSFPDL